MLEFLKEIYEWVVGVCVFGGICIVILGILGDAMESPVKIVEPVCDYIFSVAPYFKATAWGRTFLVIIVGLTIILLPIYVIGITLLATVSVCINLPLAIYNYVIKGAV